MDSAWTSRISCEAVHGCNTEALARNGCDDRSGRWRAQQGSSQLISTCKEKSQADTFSAGRPACSSSVARASEERTPIELACVVETKEAHTRTANSTTSDCGPLAQGESDGAMPDLSSEAKDLQPRSSGVRRNKSLSSSLRVSDKDSRSKVNFLESRHQTTLSWAAPPNNFRRYRATCYRAVRSGVQKRPLPQDHARARPHLAFTFYFDLFSGICLEPPFRSGLEITISTYYPHSRSGSGAQARGLGAAPSGRLWVRGARGRQRPCASEEPRA
eukprot:6206015-Pleurochrysis_carterae.AAC.2